MSEVPLQLFPTSELRELAETEVRSVIGTNLISPIHATELSGPN